MSGIRVRTAGGAYTVHVGAGLRRDAGPTLAAILSPGPALLVTDENVAPLYLAEVRDSLRAAGFLPREVVLAPGEATKTLATVEALYTELLATGTDRGTVVVALGGGVVSDLAGFAAATWLRGVPWLAIPTSLLAQVDASVGGKTGVNLSSGKNLVGSFHQPRAVLADPETLATLDAREFRSGLAEAVKTALALDAGLLRDLESDPDRYTNRHDCRALEKLVAAAAAAKARIVSEDERESGLRRVLNFGHTAGHAIEAAAGFGPVLHGEAVAVGMGAAIRASVARGKLSGEDGGRAVDLLARLGLPTVLADLPVNPGRAAIEREIAHDKKRRREHLALVLLSALGEAEVVEDGTPEELLTALGI